LAPLSKSYDGPRLAAPTGHWKDGLFDCCNAGMWHPSLWCSLCCQALAMGQVMSRMQVTWLGEPGPLNRTRQTFFVILLLVMAFFVYSIALELAAWPYDKGNDPDFIAYLRIIGNGLFTLWTVYALYRTRATVRARYQIPEERCHGCEDVCCSLWCTCCVTSQLLRHTGEYESYAGTWCSMTGHPPGTPLVV
jgi:Cys-rich protein (TIGR01571 family)